MSDGQRIPLAKAESLVDEVGGLLFPVCERLEVAGSVRRRKADVGDIEIVCIPKIGTVPDLFGEPTVPLNLLDERCAQLIGGGLLGLRPDINGHTSNGSKAKRLSYKGFGLDVFVVIPPSEWGVIFTIRTGSADFAHRLVTPISLGGMLRDWFRVKDGQLWHGDIQDAIHTPEEADFFREIGVDMPRPEDRA